jgi:CheY-like chemotaxis protein
MTILLVEDNPDHAELTKRCFEDHQIANKINHVIDGEQALDYLYQRGPFSDPTDCPRPDLILLDLRLPKIDGLGVLQEVKSCNSLQNIPVVVLTSSDGDPDLQQAYDSGANSYLVKPVDFDNFCKLVDEMGRYWLRWNNQPWSAESVNPSNLTNA